MTLLVALTVIAGAGCSVDSSKVQNAVCAELEQLSPDDLERVFQAAKTGLESQGITFDNKAWDDPDTFQRFMSEVDKASQCPSASQPKSVQSALHGDEGPDNYCGPGHGTWLPTVSACLNRACFQHDSCYARCSATTSPLCLWGGPTVSCDSSFFATADACDNTGARLRSWTVLKLAHTLAALGAALGCGSGMTCPKPGEIGQGVCATDPTGGACAACLAKIDPTCTSRSKAATDSTHAVCRWAPIDPVCVSADCQGAQKCYGVPTLDVGATCDTSAQCAAGCCMLFKDGTTKCQAQAATIPAGAIGCTCKQTADCKATCGAKPCSSAVTCGVGPAGSKAKVCGTG